MSKQPDIFLEYAIKVAVEAHSGQFDRGGTPYILHPLAVMQMVDSNESEVRQIAVMHDVIEDCKDFTYKKLKDIGFSDRVIEGLRCLTKVPGEDYDDYLERVSNNRDAILVKLSDLRHNSDIRRLKGVSEKDIARTAKYFESYLKLKSILDKMNNLERKI
jgi:(p)ppGpp synthase/HD superfamily hydrolase